MQVPPGITDVDWSNGVKGAALLWIMFRIEVMNARLKPIFKWWDERAISASKKG